MQGVRQLGPIEVFASAPGGSDSIVSETFALPDRLLGIHSQLGVHELQPASKRALATAHTRTKGVIFETASPGRPRLPTGANHTGPALAAQPEFNLINQSALTGLRPKLLRSHVL
jgi:hypothetical protein